MDIVVKRVLILFLTTVLTCVSSSLVMAASSNSFDLNVDYLEFVILMKVRGAKA